MLERKKKGGVGESSLQDPRCGAWLSSAAFSCTIYQLKRDEMSSEAASAKVSTQFEGLFQALANLAQWAEQLH